MAILRRDSLAGASANPGTELWIAAVCQHSWAFNTYPQADQSHIVAFLDAQIPAVPIHS